MFDDPGSFASEDWNGAAIENSVAPIDGASTPAKTFGYLMRWSLPPSRYYAEDRLSFGELSWKTLRSLVSIWVKTLSIFIARIVAGRLFTVKNLPGQS
ncbi:hypothetical protein ASP88_13255 [Salmonella enterica subsp. enterica serovar Dublin]|nr:hypothetical protein [Salmonella enterica subsp. enterica serovar Dublin]